MNQKILHTPEGVRDIYGREYTEKRYVEQRLQECIRSYGYEGIQTPSFEFFDVFSKEVGTTPDSELYKFFDREGNTLALRPDFTPSIARCAARYFPGDQEPLRLCYLGSAFTNTSSLQGRLKEVTQLGAELIHDNSVEADAEIISMVIEALKSLGLESFRVSIGQTEYFQGLCEEAGLDAQTGKLLREAISGRNYFATRELLEENKVPEPYNSIFLQTADMLGDMCSLAEAGARVHNDRSLAALERLERLQHVLKLYGVGEYVSFDLGLLSKYDYYTGVVFRAYTYGIGDAVVKGGRYNHLLKHFGKDAPAVGFVIVIDELLRALSGQRTSLPAPASKTVLRYTVADFPEKLAEAQRLRKEGAAVALVPGEDGL